MQKSSQAACSTAASCHPALAGAATHGACRVAVASREGFMTGTSS
jgi:hypothetical protein